MRRFLCFILHTTIFVPIFGQDKEKESFGIDVSHHNGENKLGIENYKQNVKNSDVDLISMVGVENMAEISNRKTNWYT